ncbi:MAG: DUF503 domain-containing protein [Anaerolineae bacterium]|nr:DUF503 domain-containing protein [Anaerolineae bacterium]
MVVATCEIDLQLPGVRSLKEKRSILKGLIARLHKQFNVACAEVDLHDVWQSSVIGLAVVSTSVPHTQHVLENIVAWIEHYRPDLIVVDYHIEIIR